MIENELKVLILAVEEMAKQIPVFLEDDSADIFTDEDINKLASRYRYVSSMNFSGDFNGMFLLALETDIIAKLSEKIFGFEIDPASEEMNSECVNEVLNILTGNFKDFINDYSLDIDYEIPNKTKFSSVITDDTVEHKKNSLIRFKNDSALIALMAVKN